MEKTVKKMKDTKLPQEIITQKGILTNAYELFCYISANEFSKLNKGVSFNI